MAILLGARTAALICQVWPLKCSWPRSARPPSHPDPVGPQSFLLLVPEHRFPWERVRPLREVPIDEEVNLPLSSLLLSILFLQLSDLNPQCLQLELGVLVRLPFPHECALHLAFLPLLDLLQPLQLLLLLKPPEPIFRYLFTHQYLLLQVQSTCIIWPSTLSNWLQPSLICIFNLFCYSIQILPIYFIQFSCAQLALVFFAQRLLFLPIIVFDFDVGRVVVDGALWCINVIGRHLMAPIFHS